MITHIPQGYMKVPSVFLQAEEEMKVNLFVFMPLNGKLVHYMKKGEVLPVSKLMEIMKFSGTVLLMPEADAQEGMSAISGELTESIKSDGPISEETSAKAAGIIKSMVNLQDEDAKVRITATKTALDNSTTIAQQLIERFKGGDLKSGVSQLLQDIKKEKSTLEGHQKNVASLSVLALLALHEGTSTDASDIAVAGFIHDIGMKDQGDAETKRHVEGEELHVIIDPTAKATETKIPRNLHIEVGVNTLKSMGVAIADGAMKIVAQHHENYDGSGPWGLKDNQIYKPARLIRIVDDLVCLLNCHWQDFDLGAAFDTLNKLNTVTGKAKYYDPNIMGQLQKILS